MNKSILLIGTVLAAAPLALAAGNNEPRSGAPSAPAGGATGSTGGSFLQASGFPSVHQDSPSDQLLMSEARSVRRALNQNAATAHQDVQVIIDRGRIVLRGTVSSAAVRRTAEKTAKGAISNPDVVSQLQVRRSDR